MSGIVKVQVGPARARCVMHQKVSGRSEVRVFVPARRRPSEEFVRVDVVVIERNASAGRLPFGVPDYDYVETKTADVPASIVGSIEDISVDMGDRRGPRITLVSSDGTEMFTADLDDGPTLGPFDQRVTLSM